MTAPLQLYPDLEPAVETALRSSIKRFGVIYPVVISAGPWSPGVIIDGHHRSRLAGELGLRAKTEQRRVRSEDEAREIARTLNEDRRHLWPTDQRRSVVEELAIETDDEGIGVHTPEAIAGALGVSRETVRKDIEQHATGSKLPERRRGRDGKIRPARRQTPDPGGAGSPPADEVVTSDQVPGGQPAVAADLANAIGNEPEVALSFAQTDLHRALSAVVKLRASYQDPSAAADLVPDDERDDEAIAADDAIAWFEAFRKRLRQSHLRVVTGAGR